MKNNPLFIPESRCSENSGVRGLYTFGAHQAVGFSVFDVDHAPTLDANNITSAFNIINQLSPLLLKYQGTDAINGVLVDQQDGDTLITNGDLAITLAHNFTLPWDPRSTNGSVWPEGGAIIIRLAADDYIIAGRGIVVVFQAKTEREQEQRRALGEDGFANNGGNANQSVKQKTFTGKRVGLGYVDQVNIDKDGNIVYVRRENGDHDHQGRHARILVGNYKILHINHNEYWDYTIINTNETNINVFNTLTRYFCKVQTKLCIVLINSEN